MTTSAEEQIQDGEKPQAITPLNASFSVLHSQLALATKRVDGDDLFKKIMENTKNALEQTQLEVAATLDQEAEEYNALCSELENRDETLRLTKSQLESLQKDYDSVLVDFNEKISAATYEAHSLATEAIVARDRAESKVDTLNGTIEIKDQINKELERELKRLRELEPDKLYKKNKEARTERIELRSTLNDLQTKFASEVSKVKSLKKDNTDMATKYAKALEAYAALKENSDIHNGLMDGECVKGNRVNGMPPVDFYIYRYSFGLSVEGDEEGRPRYINNIDWHLVIRTTIGASVDVKVNEWGVPQYLHLDCIKYALNRELNHELGSVIFGLLEKTHPLLIDRLVWSSNVKITDIPNVKAATLKALSSANVSTLFEIVSLPVESLVNNIKGLGEKGAKELQTQAYTLVDDWEKEHGIVDVKRKKTK